MAITWIPKATVQAVLGSILLTDAKKLKLAEYENYGTIIQTNAIISIIICAPIGAILMNSFG